MKTISRSGARTREGYAGSVATNGHPDHPSELEERDAIVNEDRYATRQTIPKATMIAGLLQAGFH